MVVLNPCADAVSLNLAAGRGVNLKLPLSWVWTVWVTPVSSLVRITVALATTAPVWSVTVPSIALVNCAQQRELAIRRAINTILADTIRLGTIEPSATHDSFQTSGPTQQQQIT